MNDEANGPISEKDPRGFTDVFPTETRGDGNIRPNNRKTGAGQGRGSFKRKVRCLQCGFPVDINRVDHSGGSLDGQGAGGAVSGKSTSSYVTTDDNGVNPGYSYLAGDSEEHPGDQAYKKGAGCPMCYSKNSASSKTVPPPFPGPKASF